LVADLEDGLIYKHGPKK